MTVAALTPQIEYFEDGVSLNFAAPFRYDVSADLEVSRIIDGEKSVLVQGTAWSATLGPTDAGGTVTLMASIGGATLRIQRITARNQATDYATGDRFPAESHEFALDRQMRIAQEQDVAIGNVQSRAVLAKEGSAGLTLDPAGIQDGELLQFKDGALRRVEKAPFAGKFLGGDGSGGIVALSGTGADAGLRTDLAAGPGGRLVRVDDGLSGSVMTTVQEFASRISPFAMTSVTHWHKEELYGSNLRPALEAAIQAVKDGKVPGRYLMIPPRVGGWTLDREVVFDLSKFKMDVYGSIKLTATAVQDTLRFVSDGTTALPARLPPSYLDDVELFFAEGVVIDGNGAAMDFPEPTPGTTPDYAALQCDHITRLRVYGGHFTNGPMNSVSFRRCPRHRFVRAEFSWSRWDNGFTASTDLATYDPLDPDTWGGGMVIECRAHDNYDFGMTAYNVTKQEFSRCESHRNGRAAAFGGAGGGYSYELGYGAASGAKDYHGLFAACRAGNNGGRGIYIDGSGVVVDDDCETWGSAVSSSDTLDITGVGVVVSSVLRSYVGGRHHHHARCGAYLANQAGVNMHVQLGGDFSENAWHGVRAQNVRTLRVSSKARFIGNGADSTLHSGVYGHGLYRSGSATGPYIGTVIIDPGAEFSRNAHRAIRIGECARASVRGAWGEDNFAYSGAPTDGAVRFDSVDYATTDDVEMVCTNARQTFVVNFETTVTVGREMNTRGNAATNLVLHQAVTRLSTKPTGASKSETYSVPALAAGAVAPPKTFVFTGAISGDFPDVTTYGGWGGRTLVEEYCGADTITIVLKNDTAAAIAASDVVVRFQATRQTPRAA